uniref:DDE_3 domain-containing protein n=1 Tax=Heterorhabditis bacteriophora TaxID=37862 RepID=A0A1I7XEV3_HETBA
MSKGKNITPNQRAMIKVLLDQNLSQVQIAKKLKLSRCHINKFGMLENAPRTPRKRSTTERIDRIIRRLSEGNRRLTARMITECQVNSTTFGRRWIKWTSTLCFLEEPEGPSCICARTPDMTKVVFSDESKFNRFGSDGKKYVRRRPGEEFMPKCTIPTIKHGGGSVMVWAAFNRNGPGPLHIAEGIMDSTSYVRILEDNLLPYARSQRLGRNWIFQQDNDPKHSSNATKRWHHQKKIMNIEWPSQSRDLNPIEHLWNDTKPSTIKTLEAVIKKAWAQISVERCANLVDSMLRRCAAVIKNFGYPTKY